MYKMLLYRYGEDIKKKKSGRTNRNNAGAHNDCFLLNTLKTLSLGMHSKWLYNILICSVILGELESFLNLRASVLFSRKF